MTASYLYLETVNFKQSPERTNQYFTVGTYTYDWGTKVLKDKKYFY